MVVFVKHVGSTKNVSEEEMLKERKNLLSLDAKHDQVIQINRELLYEMNCVVLCCVDRRAFLTLGLFITVSLVLILLVVRLRCLLLLWMLLLRPLLTPIIVIVGISIIIIVAIT